jgi:peptidoglycan/xylan/chitin deacetylase (PgdA/CDA1 family)
MKEIVNRGHAIGLHTYSHDYKGIYSSDAAYLSDLQKISDLVLQQTGVETKIMRFPGGSSNTVSKKYSKGIMSRMTRKVTEMGYIYFDWNCSNGDADGGTSVEKQLRNCSNYPKSANTIIVLMHDTRATTMEALPKIIEYYHSQGMKFGVLTTSGPTIHHKVTN